MLIHNKDDIEFVTEFPCFLGHPVGPTGKTSVKQFPEGVKTNLELLDVNICL